MIRKIETDSPAFGHLTAVITILIWGTTFISTKVLLTSFTPIEILFCRFIIGFIALNIFYPKRMKIKDRKHELLFASAGLCGITLYFLFIIILGFLFLFKKFNMKTISSLGIATQPPVYPLSPRQ